MEEGEVISMSSDVLTALKVSSAGVATSSAVAWKLRFAGGTLG